MNTSPDFSSNAWVDLAALAADAKYRAIPERDREDRRGEVVLVHILMQPHLGGAGIMVDEAGLGRRAIARDVMPEVEQEVRHRGP
jgi:hypothetical protein